MIVGVPDHKELFETARGWMNLAWSIAIDEAIQFKEIEFLFNEMRVVHGEEKAKNEIEKHWKAKILKLNNSISLLQQSLEIFFKVIYSSRKSISINSRRPTIVAFSWGIWANRLLRV